jgi:transcriptional regulator with XRE-family HTH domain
MTNINPRELGSYLKTIRQMSGLTQQQLATKINTKQPTIARFEANSHMPSIRWLYKLVKVFNLKLSITIS